MPLSVENCDEGEDEEQSELLPPAEDFPSPAEELRAATDRLDVRPVVEVVR